MPFQITPRRLVTTDTRSGQPIILEDGVPHDVLELNGCRMHRLWQTDRVPTTLPVEKDVTQGGLPRLAETFAGTRFYTAELPAGDAAPSIPMHRADSVDYVVVMRGEIVLRVGDEEERTLRAGDCLVQLGATHTWENRGDEACQLAVVVVAANRQPAGDD